MPSCGKLEKEQIEGRASGVDGGSALSTFSLQSPQTRLGQLCFY